MVSCLMVTADRPHLAARAIDCFDRQTHRNSELVIIDDGGTDYRPIIERSSRPEDIRYVRVRARADVTLGELRNESMIAAHGDWMIQWDDDDWYHPGRIAIQLDHAVRAGRGASALRWTLMRVLASGGGTWTYRADSGVATPGTLLFRRTDRRYPPKARNEDGVFMREVRRELGLAVMDESHANLFVRVHHGANTWGHDHFVSKLARTPLRWPGYAYARWLRGDVTTMSVFNLTPSERESITQLDSWPLLDLGSAPGVVT